MSVHHPREAYDGPATLLVEDTEHDVAVRLRGHFQPIDGHFHWYGRVEGGDALAEVRSGSPVLVRTPAGAAPARLSDRDPWGRFRVTGTGNPPF